jgi:hypothetical protein
MQFLARPAFPAGRFVALGFCRLISGYRSALMTVYSVLGFLFSNSIFLRQAITHD